MTYPSRERTRWIVVVVFAIGMAWVESASVYYLRALVDRLNPYQPDPLPMYGPLGQIELVREAATLVMLVTVGLLAGRTRPAQLGYTAVAFGVWDIFYYVFLRMMGEWPRSLFDWDVLFLLPLPWWGPVLAPVSIALLLIVGGTLASRSHFRSPTTSGARMLWWLHGLGIAVALYVFMADAIQALRQGLDVRQVVPTVFNWPLFCLGFALMTAPLFGSQRDHRIDARRPARRTERSAQAGAQENA